MKTPTIKPRKLQILVKPDDKVSNVLDYGIVVPENEEQEQKAIGKVIAIGDGISDIAVDDTVIYGVFAGEELSFKNDGDEVEFILLHDDDVLATVIDD